jgi:hypothetical protein
MYEKLSKIYFHAHKEKLMPQEIIKTAIEFAKNKRVQRIAIGLVVGGAVGFAIAKTVEPYLFPEVEYEMIPPYDTPEQALLREELNQPIPFKHDGTPIAQVTSLAMDKDGVTITGTIDSESFEEVKKSVTSKIAPKTKYAKPVKTTQPVQPLTAGEHMAALKEPAAKPVSTTNSTKAVTSTFSSLRGETPGMTGGGNPHKKVSPVKTGE